MDQHSSHLFAFVRYTSLSYLLGTSTADLSNPVA